jgi:hypothetical protein
MTLAWSRKHTLVSGLALIAVTNAIALGGVAYNRGGEQDSVLKLTHRELWQPHEFGIDREAGGLTLNLRWRVLDKDAKGFAYAADHYGTPAWLDRDKLAALGFDVSEPSRVRDLDRVRERQLPRDALVVLELDGPAYRTAVERARERAKEAAAREAARRGKKPPPTEITAAELLKREETVNSRLFAVDAGLDARQLRAKYPDRARHAIVRGSIRASVNRNRAGDAQWSGHIDGLHNGQINVPTEFRKAIGPVPRSYAWNPPATDGVPPFELTVAFGKRFEPWVTGVTVKQ